MSTLMVIAPLDFNDKSTITTHLVDAFLEFKPEMIVTQGGTLVHEMCQRIDLPTKTFLPDDESKVNRLIMIIEMIRISDSILILDDGNMDDYMYYGEKFRRNIKRVTIK